MNIVCKFGDLSPKIQFLFPYIYAYTHTHRHYLKTTFTNITSNTWDFSFDFGLRYDKLFDIDRIVPIVYEFSRLIVSSIYYKDQSVSQFQSFSKW